MIARRGVLGTLLAAGAGVWPAAAQDKYPSKPIRLVIPFPPGGGADAVARPLGPLLTETLGQPIVLDNRGGANGNLGAEIVAKAAPDGYTLLVVNSSFTISAGLYARLPYDPVGDFTPISLVGATPSLLATHPSVPARTVKEFVALAKAQPGKLTYGSSGIGSTMHLGAAMLQSMAGLDMVHVPYKGGGPAMTALLGNEVQIHFPAASVGMPHHKAGRARALAFTGAKRLATLPELPTIGETVTGYVSDAGWHGMFGPPKLPAAITTRLQQAVRKALQDPKVNAHFVDNGYEPNGDPPDVWAKQFREDVNKFAAIAKAAGIEPQ